MMARVSSAGGVSRAGFGPGKSCRTQRVIGIARQLPAFGFFDELKCARLLDVFDLQVLERGGHFRFFRSANSLGKSSSVCRPRR